MSPAPDRTAPPAPGPIRRFDFPEVVSERLSNGLDLRIARVRPLPVVTTSVVVDGGEALLQPARAGTAVVAGDALEGGTGSRSGAALAEALEDIGAELEVSTGWDATTVAISCLADRLDAAMALLAEVVLRPSFPAGEVERTRDQQLARLRQRAMSPSSLASDRFVELVYADGEPFGRPSGGTVGSVSGLDPEALRAFHAARYRPGGSGLVVAGDVEPEEAMTLARRHFGDWSGEVEGRRSGASEARSTERRVWVVDRPGSVQSELRIGHPGARKTDPHYFALVVLNTILGGAFTSRLNLNLREEHGFTYGVRSRFAFRRDPGPFTVSTAVGTEVTAPAVREAVGELEAMASEGPTEEEVEAARDYVAGVFPLRLETTSQVAARIAELLIYDLPDDHHATYRQRIRAVGRDDVMAAAERHLRPSEAAVVVVGAADDVAGPLEALELGPLEVLKAPASSAVE